MSIFAELEIQYPPKVGDKKTITITGLINRVNNENPKKDDENYKSKNKEDQGFYDLIPTETTNLKCSTWKLYFALKEAGVDIGDMIEIDHPATGVYKVTKMVDRTKPTKEEQAKWDE